MANCCHCHRGLEILRRGTKHRERPFCNLACYHAWRATRLAASARSCRQCREAFIPRSATTTNVGRFCSRRCVGEHRAAQVIDRFWSRVEKSEGCWRWTGLFVGGYGVVNVRGTKLRAHRFAWQVTIGKVPAELVICHKCDNPACVRPDHLFIGTQKDNMLDCSRKGRVRTGARDGINNPAASLSNAEVEELRRRYAADGGVTARSLSAIYGIGEKQISHVLRGRSYPNAPGPIVRGLRPGGNHTNHLRVNGP